MKAVYFLFISMCFLLTGGHHYAYAGTQHNTSRHSSPPNFQKTQEVKLTINKADQTVIQNTAASGKKEYLTDLEDEDENTVFVRKYTLLTNYALIFSYAFILSCLYGSFKKSLPFCWHLSYTGSSKYITLRVLRI